MWLFLFIILIGVGFYVLGAKNGLPKISLIPKSQREKRRYEERIDFLSVLKKGDNIKKEISVMVIMICLIMTVSQKKSEPEQDSAAAATNQ